MSDEVRTIRTTETCNKISNKQVRLNFVYNVAQIPGSDDRVSLNYFFSLSSSNFVIVSGYRRTAASATPANPLSSMGRKRTKWKRNDSKRTLPVETFHSILSFRNVQIACKRIGHCSAVPQQSINARWNGSRTPTKAFFSCQSSATTTAAHFTFNFVFN